MLSNSALKYLKSFLSHPPFIRSTYPFFTLKNERKQEEYQTTF